MLYMQEQISKQESKTAKIIYATTGGNLKP